MEDKKKPCKTIGALVLLTLIAYLAIGCLASAPETQIVVYERYPNEWGVVLLGKGAKFLRLNHQTLLNGLVSKEQRFTVVIANKNEGVPFLRPRIYLKIPVGVIVKKTRLWRHATTDTQYHTYWAEEFGDIYNDEVRGPDESLFLQFVAPGKYQFGFVVQGTTPNQIIKLSDNFTVDVR